MSLRKAINLMCRDCIYDTTAYGSAAQQVESCTSFECPLWRVRPVRNPRAIGWVPWSVKLVKATAMILGITTQAVEEWCANPKTPPIVVAPPRYTSKEPDPGNEESEVVSLI